VEVVGGLIIAFLAFGGIGCLAISYVWLIVVGFRVHPLWGVAVLCCYPWAAVVFVAMNWQRVRRPAFLALAGLVGTVAAGVSASILQGMR
jgi:hypothetical protein